MKSLVYRISLLALSIFAMSMGMNARTHIDEQSQIDPEEWDLTTLYSVLGMNEAEQLALEKAWHSAAPDASKLDFARALINGGAKLALQCNQ